MNPCFFDSGRILIPRSDLSLWSTIACDQFTSDPAYWEDVRRMTEGHPSAYHITLPEIYLKESEEATSRRIASINATMRRYLQDDLFTAYDGMIYVERTLRDGGVRKGLLGLLDLEQYDYHKGASSYIRATEETVLERIPPRVRIRQDASLELPHLMLLTDDPEGLLIEEIAAHKADYEILYDFDLMKESGHITGYLLNDPALAHVRAVLKTFSDPAYFQDKYHTTTSPLVFAVGDGNHSLASAKECYEQLKARIGAEEAAQHPARYALAELVNLHDDSLSFEPIYRVLIGADLEDLLHHLRAQAPAFHGGASKPGEISLHFQSGLERRTLSIPASPGLLPVSILQPLLDAYLAEHPEVQIDYIHGLDAVRALGSQENHVAITFQGMQKADLFPGIIQGGVLPRKTFSMGHAEDKRFYLEGREIL